MDPLVQLVLLLLAISLLFTLMGYLRRRPRRAVVYIALLALDLLVTVWALARPEAQWALGLGLGLFVWLVLLPGLVRASSRRMLRGGDLRRALRLLRLCRVLQPGSGLAHEVRMLEGLVLAREGELERALALGEGALSVADETLKVAVIEQLLALLIIARRFGAAVELFERQGGMPLASASAGICLTMVRAFGEVHRFEDSASCLAILEEDPATLAPAYAPSVNGARLAFVAQLGFVDHLDRLLQVSSPFLPALQEEHRQLWRGLAHARAGRREEAEALWRGVSEQSQDPQVVAVARQRLAEDLVVQAKPTSEMARLADVATDRALAYRAVPRTDRRFWRLAPVTALLLGLIGAVHLGVELLVDQRDGWYLVRLGANFGAAVRGGELWRLLTSTFLHGNLLHLGLNGYALFLLGRFVEQMFGSLRFVPLYFFAGLCGSAASVWFGGPERLSVGASGAIFGLVGGALVGLWHLRGVVPEGWRRQLSLNLLLIIALQLVLGFQVQVIDNAAHIGGLLGGAVAALALRPARKAAAGPARWLVSTLAALSMVLVAASMVLAALRQPQQTLAILPEKSVKARGVVARCPVHWVETADGGNLVWIDPLTGVGVPTLRLFSPLPLRSGQTLAGHAALQVAELQRELSQLEGVTGVEVGRPRSIASEVVLTEVRFRVGGEPFSYWALHRRRRELALEALIHLRRERVGLYRVTIEKVATSLDLAVPSDPQSRVQGPGT